MSKITEAMIDAAWQAFGDCPIDMCGDHDEEQKKCVVAAVEAALSAAQPQPVVKALAPVVTGQMEIEPDVTAADLGVNAEPESMSEMLDLALSVMNGCVHDGGFDREIGPIGCYLGDKCVCIGVYPLIAKAAAQSDYEARIRSALSVPLPEIEGGDKGDGGTRPISAPLHRSDDPTWMQVIKLFKQNGMHEPPVRLRDELVIALEWAWFAYEREQLAAARNRAEYLASRVNGPLEEVSGYIPEAFPMSSDYNKFDPIDYALHYGGRCRDCADADGVCPSSGMPCDQSEARKAAGHVLKAWSYGIEHGYIDNPLTAAPSASIEGETP